MRYLTVSVYGEYSLITEFLAVFAAFADGGLYVYYVKKFSEDGDGNLPLINGVQFVISFCLLLIMILTALLLLELELASLTLLGALGMVLLSFHSPKYSKLFASENTLLAAIRDLLSPVIKIVVVIIGVILKLDLWFFISVFLIQFIFISIFWFRLNWKNKGQFSNRIRFSLNYLKTTFAVGSSFSLLMVVNILYNKIDVFMLNAYSTPENVAFYAGATRFVYPLMFISSSFMKVIFPKLVKNSDNEQFNNEQFLAIRYLGLIGFLVSLSLFLTAPYFYEFIFGVKYLNSIEPFQSLVWYLLIVFLYGVLSNGIVAKGGVNVLLIVNIVMLTVNVLLNYFLIPEFQEIGAVWATLFCEILVFVYVVVYSIAKFKSTIPKETYLYVAFAVCLNIYLIFNFIK